MEIEKLLISNEKNQPEPQESGNLAVIGEETSSQSKISLQVLQNIYHEITGKSEDVSKSYEDPFQFSLEDLIQLNLRITVVTVKYVDYAVARNLLNTVDQWFQTIPQAHTSKAWLFITRRSHYLPLLARYFVGMIVAFLIFISIDNFITQNATFNQYAKFSFCALIGLFSAYRLAHHLGRSAEDSLDKWSQLSFISLTAGDKKLIDSAKKINSNSIATASFKFVFAILISLLAKIIVGLITT
jgi:hypothetical protein